MWIHREISAQIERAVSSFPAIILTGARQTGKTSLLQKMYPDHSFVTLDLPSNAELAENEPEEFLKRYPPPLIIDEVQYAPEIFRHLKTVIDKKRKTYGQFILTGSQKFTLMKSVSDSLAGRCAVLELETLSYSEIKSANTSPLLKAIVCGGFPELQSRKDLDRNLFYQSYLSTYLERDVRSLLNVGQLRDFERFLRACALRSGHLLNKSELARDVGITPTTANEWISVLQASNQIVLLEPWFNNKTKSLIKSPKLYLSDTGLLCYLLRLNEAKDLLQNPLAGSIWETFVFSEIRKQQTFKDGKWNIWLWRDKYGLEVDFLIEKGGFYNLIEAKLTEKPDRRDVDKIGKVALTIGLDMIKNKSIVTRTKESHPLKGGVSCLSLDTILNII